VVLMALFCGAGHLERGIDARTYGDPIIYYEQSQYQKIVLTQYGQDMRLYLNGQLQFSSLDEARYHETLAAAAMFLFGYTTLLANMYYGEVNTRYLFPDKKYAVTAYRIFALCLILFGSIVPVVSMWEFADLFGALMVLFNVIALFRLSKYVAFALKDYQEQKKVSDTPMWDYDADIVERYRSRSQ